MDNFAVPRIARDVAIVLPHLHGGGAERVAVNLANHYVAHGLAVDVVLMQAGGALDAHLDPRIQIVDLGAARLRGMALPLMRYLRAARPRSILANMWPVTVLVVALARLVLRRARVVAVEHTTWSQDHLFASRLRRLAIRMSMRLVFPFADAVVSVSDGASDDLAKVAWMRRAAVTTIHNPISGVPRASLLPPSTPAAWCQGEHRRVLAVGRLKPIKDYPTLLRAFALLRRRMDARLLILGEGGERHALQALAAELGLEEALSMPGFAGDPAPYFAHADLHVLSSKGEGFGNVLVEALEQGTPVVSTDCLSGPREILGDGRYGALVPVGDAVALAEAMFDALSRPVDRDGLRRRAADFGIDRAARAYSELLGLEWSEAAPSEGDASMA